MKRALSNLDSEPTLVSAATRPAKRPRRLPLTRKALSKTLSKAQVAQSESTASIDLWINSCTHDKRMDPNQVHPRLQAQTLRRAKARSRTPSPVKKPPHSATPEYRNGTMKLALVFVERGPDLPAHVASSVERILGREDAQRNATGQKGAEDTARDALAATLAETYRVQCQSLAGDCSGEGEWRSGIYSSLMSPLSKCWSPILKVSASEKPWNKHLKPAVLQLPAVASSLYPVVFPPPSSAALGPFVSPTATPPQDDPSTSSAVSTAASDYSTDENLQLSTPKPDITVGLASDCIQKALELPQDLLLHLQTNPSNPQPFVSDPHQVPLGLRFPFLIVEAKGLNTGGNLIHAQNQAAVAAASALNILRDLDALTSNPNHVAQLSIPSIVFSLATEGPTHELWVHYRTGNEYDMSCLESWRTTLPGHSEKLVECLRRVMEWGASDFKESIVERVGALWKIICEPEELVLL